MMSWSGEIYHIFFMCEFLFGGLMFSLPLAKRGHFLARSVAGFIAFVSLSPIRLPYGGELMIYFVAATAYIYLCRAVPLQDALYSATCGYVTQHFGYGLRESLRLGGLLFKGPLADNYPSDYIISACITVVIGLLFYHIFAKNMVDGSQYHMSVSHALSSALIVLIIVLFLSWIAGNVYEDGMESMYLICHLYDMFCCVFFLWIQTSHIQHLRLVRETALQQQLQDRRRTQYELTKENIEIINRKCHDMKHQLSLLRTIVPEEQREAYMREIDHSIRIYDSAVQTGNEVLDTVLSDKSLYCEAHEITMTIVADGKPLAFMDALDIYAIIGNALDNAIESVMQLEDPEQRQIAVSIWARNGLCMIRIENYYEGTIQFDGNLPQTTKEDKENHGYGIKSIIATSQKYGGQVTYHTDQQMFTLCASIPIPEDK